MWIGGREQEKHLRLDRVGVLEFVDEQVRVAGPKAAPHVGLADEQPRGLAEQILKREPAPLGPQPVVDGERLLERRDRDGIPMGPPLPERGPRERVAELLPTGCPAEGGLLLRGLALLVGLANSGPALLRDLRRAVELLEHVHHRHDRRAIAAADHAGELLERVHQFVGAPLRRTGKHLGLDPRCKRLDGRDGRCKIRGRCGRRRPVFDVAVGGKPLDEQPREVAKPQAHRVEIGEQLGMVGGRGTDELPPGLPPQEPVGRIVELAEAGVDARLQRPLPQQPARKRMDRADHHRIDPLERCREPGLLGRIGRLDRGPLQLLAESPAELACRLFRERDRDDSFRLRSAGAHERQHPIDHACGLARAGRGLDQERGGKIGADAVADRLVGGRRRRGRMRRDRKRRLVGPTDRRHGPLLPVAPQLAKEIAERLRATHHPGRLAGHPRRIAAGRREIAEGAVGGIIRRQEDALPRNLREPADERRTLGQLGGCPFEPPALASPRGKEIAEPFDVAAADRALRIGQPRAKHDDIQAVLQLPAAVERVVGRHRRKPVAAAALVVPKGIHVAVARVADVDPVDPATKLDRLAGSERHDHRLAAVERRARAGRLHADRSLERERPPARLAAGTLLVVEERVHRRAQLVAAGGEGQLRERRLTAAARHELLVEDREQLVEMHRDLGQLRAVDEPAHEPLEHGMQQAAGIERREPAVGVVVEPLEWLDAKAIAEEKFSRAGGERLEAVGRGGAAVARAGIEQQARLGHETVVRREHIRRPRGGGRLTVGEVIAMGGERRLHLVGTGSGPEHRQPPLRFVEGEARVGGHERFRRGERPEEIVDGGQRIADGLPMERHEGRRRKHLGVVCHVAAGEAEPHAAAHPREQPAKEVEVAGGRIAGDGEPGVGSRIVDQAAIAVGEHRIGGVAPGEAGFIEAEHERVGPAGVATPGEAAHMEAARPRPGPEHDQLRWQLLEPVEHVAGLHAGVAPPLLHRVDLIEDHAAGVAVEFAVGRADRFDECASATQHLLGGGVWAPLAGGEMIGQSRERREPLRDPRLAGGELVGSQVVAGRRIAVVVATHERLRELLRRAGRGRCEHRHRATQAAADLHAAQFTHEGRRPRGLGHDRREFEHAVAEHLFEARLRMAVAPPGEPAGEGPARLRVGERQPLGECDRHVAFAAGGGAGRRPMERRHDLANERRIGGGVGVDDLDLVEPQALCEARAEHVADFIGLASCAKDPEAIRSDRCWRGGQRRIGGERVNRHALGRREGLEQLALEPWQVEIVGHEQPGKLCGQLPGPHLLGRECQFPGLVDQAQVTERRHIAVEQNTQIVGLVGVPQAE